MKADAFLKYNKQIPNWQIHLGLNCPAVTVSGVNVPQDYRMETWLDRFPTFHHVWTIAVIYLQPWQCGSGSASAGPTDVHFNSWLSRWLRMQSRQATVRLIGSGCLFPLCTSPVWIQAHLILCLWLHLYAFLSLSLSLSGKVREPNRCRRGFQEIQRGVAQQQHELARGGLVFSG